MPQHYYLLDTLVYILQLSSVQLYLGLELVIFVAFPLFSYVLSMDIKEYDKLTSAGEFVLDVFCGLLPLCLREFSEDKLIYQKNAVCDSPTSPR